MIGHAAAPLDAAGRRPDIAGSRRPHLNDKTDEEQNRLAARVAGQRLFGMSGDDSSNAAALAAALGGLKGPIMKVAQLMATIPEALPPEYTAELAKLQSEAPPMGWAFVKRRMMAELGQNWQEKFGSFEHQPAA